MKDTDIPRNNGWIAIDLDGTLACYEGWVSVDYIGPPIPAMVARVKQWLAEGKDIRIFTARVDGGTVALSMGNPEGEKFRDREHVQAVIEAWCLRHLGQIVPITNTKDYGMIELWDDRCIQIEKNTGRALVDLRAQLEEKERELADSLRERKGMEAQVRRLCELTNWYRQTWEAQSAYNTKMKVIFDRCIDERDHYRQQCEQLLKEREEILGEAVSLREAVAKAEYEFGRLSFAFNLKDERHE
jgi:hypothetical protein